jgi:hypothetical protein
VEIVGSEGEAQEAIFDQQFACLQTRSNDPIVIKHTSEHMQFDGSYQLCVDALDIRAPELLVELFMGERLNPAIYSSDSSRLPLVEVAELLQVEEKVQVIKRALIRLGQAAKGTQEQGDVFDSQVESVLFSNRLMTMVHIAIIVVFGALWVYLVRQFKRDG